ncbi:putative disease resistance protein RGA3 [Mangifera indica]|uniref:putative disease resistance protein RGA3 n=1 Tax=Mangifera indica TaxID=29780 RepID=UPI001CFBFD4C|nr:putative disease resistance protein RGA3 [Mangifera indica]
MAESFPSSIATSILTTIAMFNSPNTRPKDITKLKETLSKIQDKLLIAEEQQAQDQELQRQLAMISDVLYDAEDMIDELRCGAVKTLGVKVSNFLASIFLSPRKIQKTRKRVEKMASGINNRCDQSTRVDSGDTVIDHNFWSTSQVLGRDDDRKEIFNFLTNNTGSVSVLSIVGQEGIGKTALTRLVYNDEMIDDNFELKLWVPAPADLEITSLMRKIYIAVAGENDYAKLAPKHTLFSDSGSGSKIVVTRSSNQAVQRIGTEASVVLNVLCAEDRVKLFEKLAFKDGANDRDPDLTEIGRGIVENCGGFPLAVQTLGSLLHQNINPQDWKLIRDDEIWRQDPERNSVISALKLSYGHLPSHLRRCLAYCSLFPKGYYFNSEYLVHSWMAQGFLAAHHENEEWKDVGMRYLKILFSRCFFQDVEDSGYYFTFKMQEPIHDFVQKAAKKECERINLGVSYPDISARHLLFTGSARDNQQLPHISANLRTIIMQLDSHNVGESLIATLTAKHKYLRLLCLRGLTFKVLPYSIGELKHLRFLDLSWNSNLQELPEAICKLQILQTLMLLGCSRLRNLRNNMQNMISLRYLEITPTPYGDLPVEGLHSLRYLHICNYFLEELPRGMRNLTSLRTIILQGCHMLTSLPLWITSLSRLEKLVIKNCRRLNLRMDSQGQGGNVCLNLQVFMIYDLQVLVDLPQLILQGSAKTLKYMRIDTCPSLQKLPAWLTTLTSLEKLEIAGCSVLESLPNGMENLTARTELKIQKSSPTFVLKSISHLHHYFFGHSAVPGGFSDPE